MSAAKGLHFYLDENMPIEIARQLRKRDIEVVTVRDLNLLGDSDENHLALATEMGCVLCTNDTDYVELAANGIEHSGIVIGQPEKHYVGDWVKWLELMHAVYTAEDMQNRVEYLQRLLQNLGQFFCRQRNRVALHAAGFCR